ncbi:MAG TPA: hypothetical protein VN764_09405, partial [Polyangiaceae bacterium]|nr:hypothetical protein [Polyangiaceae bacterium]
MFAFLLLSALVWGASQRVTVIGLSALLLAFEVLRLRNFRSVDNPMFWPLFACGAWTVLTLIPLPIAWLEIVSPKAAELWINCLSPWQQPGPTWAPLAIDPGAAWFEALKWFGYVFVSRLAARVTQDTGFNRVLASVFGIGVILALVTLVQAVIFLGTTAGVDYGLAAFTHNTLIVNPNNLAGFLNLGGACGLGLVVSRRSPISPTMSALGVCLCFSTSVWTGSRAGVAALVALLFVVGGYWVARIKRQAHTLTSRQLALGAVIGVGIPVISFLGINPMLHRDLFSDDLSKLELLPRLAPALRDFWLVGVGRGGFESISQLYMPSGQNVVFRYVENFVGSWLLEWGIPFGAALTLLTFLVLRPHFLKLRLAPPAQAAFAGVVAVFVQNLADLGLELFSLAATTIAVISALLSSRSERTVVISRPGVQKASFVAALCALLLSIMGSILTGPDAYVARERLSQQLNGLGTRTQTDKALLDHVRREIVKRPADPYPFIVASMAAARSNQPILPWAAAALRNA